MAKFLLSFLFFFSAATTTTLMMTMAIEAQNTNNNNNNNRINLGSSLIPGSPTNSSWLSPSRRFAFGFYQQSRGVALCIFFVSDRTIVWTANRDTDPFLPNVTSDGALLLLTSDGRLAYRQTRGGAVSDTSVVSPSEPIGSASMLDNGNFVLYNTNSTIIWQSFDYPTNTLLPGQRLLPGQELISSASTNDSSKGIFRLKMQTDGNLVQYPVNTLDSAANSYYSSVTAGYGNNVTLNFKDDGYLYLLNGSAVIRNITKGRYPTTSSTIYLLRVDVDGIFRVYSKSLDGRGNDIVIYSPTEDKCVPKGLCGVNGYCVTMDEDAQCICLPGFDFLVPGNWSMGCGRSAVAAKACGGGGEDGGGKKEDNSNNQYEMRTLQNVIAEDDDDGAYTSIDGVTQEQCRDACLNDCNCDAAFFKDSWCKKQRLPLIYGRRDLSDSNTVLVKLYVSANVTTTGVGGGRKEDLGGGRGRAAGSKAILIVGIVLMALGISIMAMAFIYARGSHYKKIAGGYGGDVKLVEDVGLRAFSYADLSSVTDGFGQELGRGSSGTVYRGVLPESQTTVAVKRLEKEFAQGNVEFRTEMKAIGKTYHRNLVRLLGYCLEGTNRLLVFEYMSNGSLADFLFKQDRRPSWGERINIALDLARGILYLHEECQSQIIHCDIKPQNILMDERGCAKISDFGLAKLLKQGQTNTYTGIRGTKGYVAPEWHRNQPVTVKADVYSFGIVLLEVVCCRKSVDWSLPEDEAILEEWVYSCYESGEMKRLVGDEEVVELRRFERMVKIGIWCIQDEPSLRPTMKKVLLMLEGTVEIPVPPCPTSFLSSV